MPDFDFKKYHYRSINAASATEQAAINQELKDLYTALPDDEKAIFNEELQSFLAKEMGRLKSNYESMQGTSSDN